MGNIEGGGRTPAYQIACVRYATRLRTVMADRNVSRKQLAERVGVSGVAVGLWMRARYLPRPDIADRIATFLADGDLANLAMTGRRVRCAVCGRAVWRGETKRRYCSDACRNLSKNPKTRPQAAVPEAEAIRLFCHSCEPDGLCRMPACFLQPYSPLPLIQVYRNGAA